MKQGDKMARGQMDEKETVCEALVQEVEEKRVYIELLAKELGEARALHMTQVHCKTLQHTAATHCNTLLQHNTLQHAAHDAGALQHTATHCCNTLQHTVATQHTATRCT